MTNPNSDNPTPSSPKSQDDESQAASQPAVESLPPWKEKIHEIIFEADTPLGRAFDIGLLWAIIVSVACVILDSVDYISEKYHLPLLLLEWNFTIVFTIEYILRLICLAKPSRYAFSFFGIVDLLAILPTYLSIIFPGTHQLMTIRSLRLLRIFRILKLARYISDSRIIVQAVQDSRRKIFVFFSFVLTIALIMGSIMYMVESNSNSGFTSIPRSMYWAIVTMTTVGYGDIAPQSPLGQTIAAALMIIGYSIIAVPTGIISAEIAAADARFKKKVIQDPENAITTISCNACGKEDHDQDAVYCKYCGEKM